MGEENQSTTSSLADIVRALKAQLPQIVQTINAQLRPTAIAQLQADQAVSPEYAKMQADLYSKYAPELSAKSDEINAASNLRAAQSEADIAGGDIGQALVDAFNLRQAQVDPEWTAAKKQLGENLSKYLGALGEPGKLTAAEREEMQRGLGARGFTNTSSALDAARNAVEFGSASTNKLAQLGQNLSTAAGVLPRLQSGVTGFEIATKRQLGQNTGAAATPGVTTGTGQAAYNMGNQTMGLAGALQQQWNAQQNQAQAKTLGNIGTGVGIGGKFIGGIGKDFLGF